MGDWVWVDKLGAGIEVASDCDRGETVVELCGGIELDVVGGPALDNKEVIERCCSLPSASCIDGRD